MKVAVFSSKPYDRKFFEVCNAEFQHDLHFFEPRLTPDTVSLAADFDAVCVFVNDEVNAQVLQSLAANNVKLAALRCAGFNNVDLAAAKESSVRVVRVPAYSPHSVAEHAVALILTLNRNIHRATSRVREGNFQLNGLLGFDLFGRTVGVVGAGKIGAIFAKIMAGFGCRVLAFDSYKNPAVTNLGGEFVSLEQLFAQSDIISLHCPLTPETHHLIDNEAVAKMKQGVMIINTSRGAVIDTSAVIAGLKARQIGYLGLDVYEEEADLFFEDLSNEAIADDQLARLLTFPNVVITGHQGFFTNEAMTAIAETTLRNVADVEKSGSCENEVTVGRQTK